MDSAPRPFVYRLIAAASGILALYLVLLTGQRAVDAYRANQEVQALRRDIDGLKSRNLRLQEELASSRLDEDIERIAREELNLIKPGDHPLMLIWPAASPTVGEASREESEPTEPHWRPWLRLFFDIEPARR